MKVFITGASSDIGQALARHYASLGAELGLVGRRRPLLDSLAAELNTTCAVYALDVRDSAALEHAAQDFMQRLGVPDIVIANAGVSRGTLTGHQQDTAVFQAIFDTNVLGMLHTFQPFIAAMSAAAEENPDHYRLVGIASVAGI